MSAIARLCALALLWLVGPPALQPPDSRWPSTVLLVSIDGFRADYPRRHAPTHLLRLGQAGVRAEALIPVFPSKTFPTHYSMVTGLYPEHHGILGNTIYDSLTDEWFRMSTQQGVGDGRWWGGEPLWITAEKQGLRAATCFWPGSEAAIDGVRPSEWRRYDGRFSTADRIDLVLEWLDRPPAERPRFLTLYLTAGVDGAGHRAGPESEAVAEAVAQADRQLGRLLAGLATREIDDDIDVIVVSDHGMAAVDPQRTITLDGVDLQGVVIDGSSPVLGLHAAPDRVPGLYRALKELHPHLTVYRREEIPAALHFREHPRIAPLLVVADEGWTVTRRRPSSRRGGAHGWDPRLPSMQTVFFARGPSFRRGQVSPPFESIHLYELICHILGLKPADNDGTLDAVRHLLEPRR